MIDYLTLAIKKLKPTAEFSFVNENYDSIEWHVLDGDAPTKAEINQAIEEIKANELAEIEAKSIAKTTAQSKLEALGLTIEDLTALGL